MLKPSIVTSYRLAGTRSYRLASAQLFSYGINGQNFDKQLGSCLRAPEGYSIVQSDQAGAEALIVAYLARPGRYRALFENGIKPHTYLAMHLFPEKWDFAGDKDFFLSAHPSELKAHPHWKALNNQIKNSGFPYDIGKRTAHGKSYRMGPRTFQMANLKQSGGTLVLSIPECIRFLTMFETLFPEVIEWQTEIELIVRSTRLLHNLFNFPGTFERAFTDSYIREAISWIPQSTVGCLTHIAAIETAQPIAELGGYIANNKHDSFAAIVPNSAVPVTVSLMETALRKTFTGRDGVKFTMGVETQVGSNWGKYDPKKSPGGMREWTS